MKNIILILFLALVTFCQAQFTPFDPSKAINSQGAVDNYMALDTLKYEVSYSLKKAKNKANLSQTTVDEYGNSTTVNYFTRDTADARQWIEANISLHDSIISKIDAEFTQMEQMQQYIRQEMDKIITRKQALRRERTIAQRSKDSLKKVKI